MSCLFVVLSVITIVYFILSAKRDLKERMVYGFPALVLTVLWSVYLAVESTYEMSFLISFWCLHLILYLMFNKFHIWGAGDSDVFLLFANLCLVAVPRFFVTSAYMIVILECFCIVLALSLSILIGKVEGSIKQRKVDQHYGVAVIPGMMIVAILLCMSKVIWRLVS